MEPTADDRYVSAMPPKQPTNAIHNPIDKNMPEQGSTIDSAETAKFNAMAAEWWDMDGKFKPLHQLNPVRLDYIKRHICAHFQRNPNHEKPFEGLRLLDIGCGGGLLSEPMARLGADILGADAGETNIKIAQAHAQQSGLAIDYRVTTAEALAQAGETFNVILNMEVIEHVADIPLFMKACANLLRADGILIFSTINRTVKAFAFAIIGAEYVLRLLPHGTHNWHKFITPDELADYLAINALEVQDMVGLHFNPLANPLTRAGSGRLANTWKLSRDLSVNYMGLATRQHKANNVKQ